MAIIALELENCSYLKISLDFAANLCQNLRLFADLKLNQAEILCNQSVNQFS